MVLKLSTLLEKLLYLDPDRNCASRAFEKEASASDPDKGRGARASGDARASAEAREDRAGTTLIQTRGHLRDVEIDRITDDSRELTERSIFAITQLSGQHLESALQRNPAAMIIPPSMKESKALQSYCKKGIIIHGTIPARSRTEYLLSRAAGELYGHPDRHLRLTAITGTNGKTSISRMLYHAWKKSSRCCGVIGTLGANYYVDGREHSIHTGYTTPRSYQLLKLLSQMKEAGVEVVALEASSEALALGRLEGICFHRAVFCGLTVDHLDYHRTMARYFLAKAHLFTLLKRSQGTAIVQSLIRTGEDEYSQKLQRYLKRLDVPFETLEEFQEFELNMPVEFNQRNASLAWKASDADFDAALFADMPDVPGRMNRIEILEGLDAIVDYAHTPDALDRILRQLRNRNYDRLFCVFGCGGNRDASKRIMMGRSALENATDVIVTDDNPRKENPAGIRKSILEAQYLPDLKPAFETLEEIGDRRQAINSALNRALALVQTGKKCCVLVAGKGHEDYQIYGNEKRHFSDAEVILEYKSQKRQEASS